MAEINVHGARSPFYTWDTLYTTENKWFTHFTFSSESSNRSELVLEVYSIELNFLGADDIYLLF